MSQFGKTVRSAAAVLTAAFALGGCSNSSTGPRVTIHVLPDQLWLRLGDSVQLTATAVNPDSSQLTASITFSVSDTTIAQVTPSGLLHARHKVGHATVTAAGAGTEVQLPLSVTGTPVAIVVQPADTFVLEGASIQFRAYVRDSISDTVPYRTITFTSSDTTVARVTAAGLATGIGGGAPVLVHAASGLLGGDASLAVRDSNLLASFSVANAPYSVAVSSGLASVTSISAGRIHRINVASRAITDSMAIGANNVQVRLSPSGDTAYVSDRQTGRLYRFRWSTHAIIDSVSLGEDVYGLAVASTGKAFTASGSGAYVFAVQFGGTRDSATIAPPVSQMALSGDTLLFASIPSGGQVAAFSTSTLDTQATYLTGKVGKPQQIVVSPDGSELYVADESGPLRVVGLAGGTQVDSVMVSGGAFSVALSTDGSTLYVGTSSGLLYVINRATRAVKHKVYIGGSLRSIGVDPVSGLVVIANEGLNEVNIAR